MYDANHTGSHRVLSPAGDLLTRGPWTVTPRNPGHHSRAGHPPHRTRRALLLEDVHDDAVDLLQDAGFHVDRRKTAMTEEELVEAVEGVELLGTRSTTQVTRRVLAAADRLRAVGAFCIGTNQVDLRAATACGVAVFNAPYSNTRSVVELAVAQVIALTRQLPVRNAALHAGVWDKTAAGSHEVRGRCLGIIGYGNIGSQLSVLAEALGMTVVFHDVADRLPRGNARRCATLRELLERADAVTLHVDGRPENAGLIGERELAAMKPGAVLLNLSRGSVVDLAALRRHLDSGHLSGAAIDVFPDEPTGRGERFDHDLRGVPNVILTPHVGGSTQEAQQDIGVFVADKLRAYAQDATTTSSVNLPDTSLPRTRSSSRVQLLHHPSPGDREYIDEALRLDGVQVLARAHASSGQISHVLLDVPPSQAGLAVAALADMPGAVRLEVRP